MKLRSVVRWCVGVSVALFCIAMGCYTYMRLDIAKKNRAFDLYSLVPANSIGVLESEDVSAFFHEVSMLNYSQEFERFQFSGLMNFILKGLGEYAATNAHGLDYQMNHLLVSFHASGTPRDQVIYFHMHSADKDLLTDLFAEYAPNDYLPKEEVYRGKRMVIYPLGYTEYLATYAEDGFLVVSFQKKLIEQVIDTHLDGYSLQENPVFDQMQENRKSRNLLTLYSHSIAMPLLNRGDECWSEYDIHLNSDVLYLAGNAYQVNEDDSWEDTFHALKAHTFVKEPGLMISANNDSTAHYIDVAGSDAYRDSLFERCVANLTQEAELTLVVDMQKVCEDKARFKEYLPKFVLENAQVFCPFILSVQYTLHDGQLSHFWVLTYKY